MFTPPRAATRGPAPNATATKERRTLHNSHDAADKGELELVESSFQIRFMAQMAAEQLDGVKQYIYTRGRGGDDKIGKKVQVQVSKAFLDARSITKAPTVTISIRPTRLDSSDRISCDGKDVTDSLELGNSIKLEPMKTAALKKKSCARLKRTFAHEGKSFVGAYEAPYFLGFNAASTKQGAGTKRKKQQHGYRNCYELSAEIPALGLRSNTLKLIVCSSKTRALLEQDAKRQQGETSAEFVSSMQETLHEQTLHEQTLHVGAHNQFGLVPDLSFNFDDAEVADFTSIILSPEHKKARAEAWAGHGGEGEGARPASGMLSVEMEQAIRAAYHAGYADRDQNKQPTPDPEAYLLRVIPQALGKSG